MIRALPILSVVKRVVLCCWALTLGCGSSSDPAPATVERAPAASAESAPKLDLGAKPEVARDRMPAPERARPAPVAALEGTVPQVPAGLRPLPEPAVQLVVTPTQLRLGEQTWTRATGAAIDIDALKDAAGKTTGTVVVAAESEVSALTVQQIVDTFPAGRGVALAARGADGAAGVLDLASAASGGAPIVRVADDGFHLALEDESKTLHLQSEAGEPFDYVALRNKAKVFRTQNPSIDSVRVKVEAGVSAEVLLRALSQLRGPKCTEEPARCWLPSLAFGDRVRVGSAKTSSPRKVEFPPPDDGSSPGTVTLGKAKVGKGLDKAEVRATLKRRIGYARMCYFAALIDEPQLSGKVVLRLTVDAEGKIEEVGTPTSTLEALAVEECLERGIEGLRFSAPSAAPVTVDVPLTFEPK